MVIAHTPRAGQFSKRKSVQQMLRPLLITTVSLMLMMFLLGFFLGVSLSGKSAAIISTVALGILAATGWFAVRHMDRVLERFSRRRLALLRGGEAEAYVSMQLRDNLGDEWELWDNVMLDAMSDIDHVLIGPAGLFVISTKSQRGRFILNGANGPELNGEPKDWCNDVTRQAMRLRDKITVVERDGPPPWIQTILCLPFAHIEPRDSGTHRATCGTVWVVNEDDLVAAVEGWPERKNQLSTTARTRWAAAVGQLAGGTR